MRLVILSLLVPSLAFADDAPSESRRISVGVSLGAAAVKPDGFGKHVDLTELQLSGRYQLRPRFALALSVIGGREGGAPDSFTLGGAMLDARFLVYPTEAWAPYAFAGVGAIAIANDMTSDFGKGPRAAARVGAGIERRWGAVAIDAAAVFTIVAKSNTTITPRSPPPNAFYMEFRDVAGVALMIGGSYYF